uniref:Uncharacterized protein n=1 Tax=Lepeophtheirus salmonis TaxID=72036 RepID=A0A0K2U7R1_LEPSM
MSRIIWSMKKRNLMKTLKDGKIVRTGFF